MRLGVMVLACGLAACGRVGFDARGGGGFTGSDASGDGSGAGRDGSTSDGIPPSLAGSLFAWYPLDEDTSVGAARDASGHNRTMTCTPPPRCPRPMPGRMQGVTSALFDGADTMTWQPTGTEADLPQFTAAAWILLQRRPGSFEMVVARPLIGGSANSFALDHAPSGLLEYYSQGGASLFSTMTLPIGTWTHVAIAYDGSSKYVFINGALEGSGSTGVPLTYDASPMTLGADITAGATTNFFQGQIADVMIFDRALSAAEITMLVP